MTVEEAVLQLIIDYLESGNRYVPIHLVERAHPVHQLSGRARLRALRQKGIVDYRYDKNTNCYEILSSIEDILFMAEKYGYYVTSRRKQEIKPPPETERVSIEDIRKLRELLGGE